MSRMDEAYVALLDKAFPNEKTRENYKSRIRGLLKNLAPARLDDIIKNPDTHYPTLQKKYESITTRKNMLTMLLVLFREEKSLMEEHADAHAKWKKLHDDLVRLQEAKAKRSEPEDKQVEKYTSYEEIEAKYAELKKKTPHNTERSSMQFLLLGILVHLRPKRADLGAVRIVREKDPRRTDENYIVLKTKGSSYLVMNLYKTSKYYQTVEEDLPPALVSDIQDSLRRWPREHMFRKEDGDPMSNNTYTVFVKTTFEQLFGRATGVSLLRHIYITEKLNFDDMTLEEQEKEAKYMLHTSGLQRRYKWPKKVICPKLCAAFLEPHKRTRRVVRKSANITKRATKRKAIGGDITTSPLHQEVEA